MCTYVYHVFTYVHHIMYISSCSYIIMCIRILSTFLIKLVDSLIDWIYCTLCGSVKAKQHIIVLCCHAPFWTISYYDKCKRCKGSNIVFYSILHTAFYYSLPTCGLRSIFHTHLEELYALWLKQLFVFIFSLLKQ